MEPTDIAVFFELGILVVGISLLVLIFRRYQVKKQQLTLLLFTIFLNLIIAIFFSWIAKIEFILNGYMDPQPSSEGLWFLGRLASFRISFVFVSLAIYFSYVLKVKIFDNEYKPLNRWFVIGFGGTTGAISLLLWEVGNTLFDVIAFLFVFLYMTIVYATFMRSSLKAYKNASDQLFKQGFLALSIMALFLIMVFLMFLLDRVWILATTESYSFFYYLAWSSGIMAMVSAYLGYIRPGSKRDTGK